ncbi:hypothetical protein [Phosphitispora sp. TUW77]
MTEQNEPEKKSTNTDDTPSTHGITTVNYSYEKDGKDNDGKQNNPKKS